MIATAAQLPGPGVYQMSDAEYFALPYASKSRLCALMKSAEHLKHEIETGGEEKRCFDFGSAFDAFVLTPETFAQQVAIAPDVNKRTNAGKAEYAEFEEANRDKTIITADEFATIKDMAQSLREHAVASRLLWGAAGKNQVVLIWDDEETGVRCKAKIDRYTTYADDQYLTPDGLPVTLPVHIDLKSARDCEPGIFAKHAEDYHYPLQVVHYRNGRDTETRRQGRIVTHARFFFIVCDKTPDIGRRHHVEVMEYDEADLEHVARVRRDLLLKWKQCHETNTWPGRPQRINLLRRPTWAVNQEATAA